MANAHSLSVVIVFRKKVLILFRVEKLRSALAVVIGAVIRIFISSNTLENVEHKPPEFCSANSCTKPLTRCISYLEYKTQSSVLNFTLSSIE